MMSPVVFRVINTTVDILMSEILRDEGQERNRSGQSDDEQAG